MIIIMILEGGFWGGGIRDWIEWGQYYIIID